MTPAQFDLVAELLRSRDPVRSAARLVLIDGASTTSAAGHAGVSSQSVSNALAWSARKGEPCRNPVTKRCSTKVKYGKYNRSAKRYE